MKIKTSELTGAALDWAVRECLDRNQLFELGLTEGVVPAWRPSHYWGQGGPIIEREKINLSPPFGCEQPDAGTNSWGAYIANKAGQIGPTPLIAAMRCFVASKLGDEVGVPEELCK